jgi:hypothetical protein
MGIPLRIVDPDEPGRRLEPGDMWHDHDHDAAHAACWAVVLPNREIWYSCQPFGGDPARGYWAMTGEAPNLTVHPSINDQGPHPWHGWIRNGELVNA